MRSWSDSRLLLSLATSLEAGLAPVEAVAMLRSPSRLPGSPHVGPGPAAILRSGRPLHEALRAAGWIDATEAALLGAGEASGEIPEALRQLVADRERRTALRARLLRRAAYPLLVIHLAALVAAWLAYLRDDSALIAALGLLGPLWLAAGAGAWASRRSRHDRRVAGLLRGIPLLGPQLEARATLTFLRVFRTAYAAGLTMTRAAELARDSVSDPLLRDHLGALLAGLREGRPFAEQLACLPRLAPQLTGILTAGEHSGSLTDAIDQVVKTREQDLESAQDRLLTIVGVTLHGLAIAVVAYEVIGFYAAYFNRIG